jgi:hypothetical protein
MGGVNRWDRASRLKFSDFSKSKATEEIFDQAEKVVEVDSI